MDLSRGHRDRITEGTEKAEYGAEMEVYFGLGGGGIVSFR